MASASCDDSMSRPTAGAKMRIKVLRGPADAVAEVVGCCPRLANQSPLLPLRSSGGPQRIVGIITAERCVPREGEHFMFGTHKIIECPAGRASRDHRVIRQVGKK